MTVRAVVKVSLMANESGTVTGVSVRDRSGAIDLAAPLTPGVRARLGAGGGGFFHATVANGAVELEERAPDQGW